MQHIHQKMKNIQVTIHDRINENKEFQQKLDNFHKKAEVTIGQLKKTIKDFTPITENFHKKLPILDLKRHC